MWLLGLLLGRLRGWLGGGRLLSRSALRTAGCVDEGFNLWVVGGRGRGNGDDGAKDRVKMGGEVVPAWVDVDGGVEGPDEDGLFDAPFCPIVFGG